ncbi:MAG: hypothetical protein ABUL43_01590 [Hyphomicrobium sp.]
MAEDARIPTGNTSLYYPFFQYAFEVADITSMFWQPMLKAMGRTQLEFASMQARQARAYVHWAHRMMQPTTPADFLSASTQLWTTVADQYVEAVPRVAAAMETAAEAVTPKVLPLPIRQPRDTLILLDRGESADMPERQVA